MSEHFQAVVDHVMGDDDSELGKVRAERDYALHSLEREIAICAATQAKVDALVKAIAPFANITEFSPLGDGKIDRVEIEVSMEEINTAQAVMRAAVGSPKARNDG